MYLILNIHTYSFVIYDNRFTLSTGEQVHVELAMLQSRCFDHLTNLKYIFPGVSLSVYGPQLIVKIKLRKRRSKRLMSARLHMDSSKFSKVFPTSPNQKSTQGKHYNHHARRPLLLMHQHPFCEMIVNSLCQTLARGLRAGPRPLPRMSGVTNAFIEVTQRKPQTQKKRTFDVQPPVCVASIS